jgi:murein L,D-transpeptidase YcbB/YkuD
MDAATIGNDPSWLEDIPTSIYDIVIREQIVPKSSLDPDYLDHLYSYSH